MPYRFAYSLILWRHFLNRVFCLSDDYRLCQIDIKLTSQDSRYNIKNLSNNKGGEKLRENIQYWAQASAAVHTCAHIYMHVDTWEREVGYWEKKVVANSWTVLRSLENYDTTKDLLFGDMDITSVGEEYLEVKKVWRGTAIRYYIPGEQGWNVEVEDRHSF